ncbi:hypothetical protein HDV05_003762 [Chytridiales sp. JEL 0842]|nr:hypothetical protein HDV05_003762 [Chytridiales sp. JEL 0842]
MTISSKIREILASGSNSAQDSLLAVALFASLQESQTLEKDLSPIAQDLAFLQSIFSDNDLAQLLNSVLKVDAQSASLVPVPNPTSSDRKTSHSVAIHGGVGEFWITDARVLHSAELALAAIVRASEILLSRGEKAVDVAEIAVKLLENCELFNAGKGAIFNENDQHELEACIVDGQTGRTGAVALATTIKNPISAARAVLNTGRHSLIVGPESTELIAKEAGLPLVPNSYFSVEHRRRNHVRGQTVGVVVKDVHGNLAAASSTGGMSGKQSGRVGDVAVVGAGIYCDKDVAIACTGDGDVFLRHSVASKAAQLHTLNDRELPVALSMALESISKDGNAQGGMIAIDKNGNVAFDTNSTLFSVGLASSLPNQSSVSQVIRKATGVLPQLIFAQNENYVAAVSHHPTTPDQVTVEARGELYTNIFGHLKDHYIKFFTFTRDQAAHLKDELQVQRCAMVTDGSNSAQVIPLHGLGETWAPVTHDTPHFHVTYPGYVSSHNGPKMDASELGRLQDKVKAVSGLQEPYNYTFDGPATDENLFAKIVRGELDQWRVWESETHVAFLTPFGNTPGFTVVVPRKHLGSDIFALSEKEYVGMVDAAFDVAQCLKAAFDVEQVGMIFEGYEIDYAHVKLIPCHKPVVSQSEVAEFHQTYPGFVTSQLGARVFGDNLDALSSKLNARHKKAITGSVAPTKSWLNPQTHFSQALQKDWYRSIFRIQSTLVEESMRYFMFQLRYKFPLVPVTTDCISSPMGLGSDSLPVEIDLFGDRTYLADSMQFTLEYVLRLERNLPGAFYVAPSFRGEDPDATHLNQFYHVECELLGDIDAAISTAERYIEHLTKAMLKDQSDTILSIAGTLDHVTDLLSLLDKQGGCFKRITVDDAIDLLTANGLQGGKDLPEGVKIHWEFSVDGHPELGRKLTRAGEVWLIQHFGGAVWLTEFDHLSCPFYQAYTDDTKTKAKCADLLLGLGETLGLGERHATRPQVLDALDHHQVSHDSYKWYTDMREVEELTTSGWGMGIERYTCWLLKLADVRDLAIFPRTKGWTIEKPSASTR